MNPEDSCLPLRDHSCIRGFQLLRRVGIKEERPRLQADNYKYTHDYRSEESHAKKCVEILTAHPRNTPELPNALRTLIECYQLEHKDKEAAEVRKRLAEIGLAKNKQFSDFLTNEEMADVAKAKGL